jgi:hypothetical protein
VEVEMGDLVDGSPLGASFHYRIVGKSPQQTTPVHGRRRSTSSRSSLSPFIFRDVTKRPSPLKASPRGYETNPVLTDDESVFIMPDFSAVSEEPSPELPTFSKLTKMAAVHVLSSHQHASIKPLCDKIYARFFQRFDEWHLGQRKERGRKAKHTERIDDIQINLAETKLSELEADVRKWGGVRIDLEETEVETAPEVQLEKTVEDLKEVENLIIRLDGLRSVVSRGYANGEILTGLEEEIALHMNRAAKVESILS